MQVLVAILRTMRPKQWTKSILFVFPALIFDRQMMSPESFIRVGMAAALLILMSGTIYIVNDLVDVEKDRQHPKKRFRPIAAGELPVNIARVTAVILPSIALMITLLWETGRTSGLFIVLTLYLLLQLAYSFLLKNIVIVDVLTIMLGFILRVIAGAVVINVANFSPWLYACSGLLALFLAVSKRRQELVTLGEAAIHTRPIFKHYTLPLIDDMLRMITTSTFITFLLYTIEVDVARINGINLALITAPIVVYGLFRYLYLIHVKGEGGAPDEVLLTDHPLQIAIVGWGAVFMILLYIIPRG